MRKSRRQSQPPTAIATVQPDSTAPIVIPSWETHGVKIPPLPVPRAHGQPSQLTQDIADILIHEARRGQQREAMARAAGITLHALYLWLRLGRAGDPRYAPMVQAIDKHEVHLEGDMANVAVKAALMEGDWQAAIAWLERRHPERWGAKHQVEVKVKSEVEALFAHLQATISPEAYAEVVNACATYSADSNVPSILPPETGVIDVPYREVE